MESVGIYKEEGNLNTHVPEPHTITYYSPSPHFLAQISNPAAESSPLSENDDVEANNDNAIETVQWDEGGKYSSFSVEGISDYFTLKVLH